MSSDTSQLLSHHPIKESSPGFTVCKLGDSQTHVVSRTLDCQSHEVVELLLFCEQLYRSPQRVEHARHVTCLVNESERTDRPAQQHNQRKAEASAWLGLSCVSAMGRARPLDGL